MNKWPNEQMKQLINERMNKTTKWTKESMNNEKLTNEPMNE